MTKPVWITSAWAECDECQVTYGTNNAMALMAKHCKKTGHTASVTQGYGIDYNDGKKQKNPKEQR